MHGVVNMSSLPVYKKYRIASLLCFYETSVYVLELWIIRRKNVNNRKDGGGVVQLVASLTADHGVTSSSWPDTVI